MTNHPTSFQPYCLISCQGLILVSPCSCITRNGRLLFATITNIFSFQIRTLLKFIMMPLFTGNHVKFFNLKHSFFTFTQNHSLSSLKLTELLVKYSFRVVPDIKSGPVFGRISEKCPFPYPK